MFQSRRKRLHDDMYIKLHEIGGHASLHEDVPIVSQLPKKETLAYGMPMLT